VATSPSYGLALVSVLVAGAIENAAVSLFVGALPLLGAGGWYVVGSAVGALAVWLVLGVAGYEISYPLAALALFGAHLGGVALLGALPRVAGPALPLVLPSLGAFAALPILLLTAFVVQLLARRRDLAPVGVAP
jgi:hypothetical protein